MFHFPVSCLDAYSIFADLFIQFLVSVPLRMAKLWAFSAMVAQVRKTSNVVMRSIICLPISFMYLRTSPKGLALIFALLTTALPTPSPHNLLFGLCHSEYWSKTALTFSPGSFTLVHSSDIRQQLKLWQYGRLAVHHPRPASGDHDVLPRLLRVQFVGGE